MRRYRELEFEAMIEAHIADKTEAARLLVILARKLNKEQITEAAQIIGILMRTEAHIWEAAINAQV